MQKPTNRELENLGAVHTHTHTHTSSVSGYLVYKKIDIEKIETHVRSIYFGIPKYMENVGASYCRVQKLKYAQNENR